MSKLKFLQGVRIMQFNNIYERWKGKHLTAEEAAELLGVHKRTFRRQCRSYESKGANGLYDLRLVKAAHNAASVDEVMDMLTIFETRYHNFTAAHFYDKWLDSHNGTRSYSWVKSRLQEAGLIKKSKLKGKHRKKRPRRPLPGMLIHQDGSTHEWVSDTKWDLIVTMDDATNEIYSAFFVDEEGTWSSMLGVKEVIEQHGLFCSFYTDRGSHYWHTKTAGDKVNKHNLTQFGRALQQLGIEMIPAYSPEARGRSERMFGTLQSRLPKELALANITDMIKANKFLKEEFVPAFNRKFMVTPIEEGSAFVPWLPSNVLLKDILCIQEQRTVNNDNTVSYKNKIFQLPSSVHRCHYAKAKIRVNEYIDGSIAIFHGPRKLAEYDVNGNLKAANGNSICQLKNISA